MNVGFSQNRFSANQIPSFQIPSFVTPRKTVLVLSFPVSCVNRWQAYLDIADGFNCDVVHDNAVCQSNFWLNDAIGANGAVLDGCLL